MKNFIAILLTIIILVLSALIINKCEHRLDTPKGNIIKSDTIIKHDTITYHDTVSKPVLQFRDTGSTHYILSKVDSMNIFKKYDSIYRKLHTKNIYDRILKDDSTALVRVKDTVYENELQRSEFIFQNRTPTYYITNTVMAPATGKLLIGGEYAFKSNEYRIGVHYMTKGYMEYIYMYNPQRGEHSVGFYMTIFPRNRSPSK